MKYSAIALLFLAFVHTVAADVYYVGPTVGGIIGLVRIITIIINLNCYVLFFALRLSLFWI